MELCPFIDFQILPFLKIFITDFQGTMKARKLINMDSVWMYRVYRNRGQGSIFRIEVLRPSQPSGVMSSSVSIPNHKFTGQAWSSKRLTSIVHILSPEN